MTIRTIMAAIDERLLQVDFDPERIGTTNVTYRPDGRPYLLATMAMISNQALTLGADKSVGGAGYTDQWQGTYQVEICWPENTGSDGLYGLQAALLKHFARGLTLDTADGRHVRFDAPTILPTYLDGAWVRGAVRCPWWCLEEL